MKIIPAIAGCQIERGQFCVADKDGLWRPKPSMKGAGGIARQRYVGEWPPNPIAEGEAFEIMTDGGAIAQIGKRTLWVEIRDGAFKIGNHEIAHRGELRAALFEIGVKL